VVGILGFLAEPSRAPERRCRGTDLLADCHDLVAIVGLSLHDRFVQAAPFRSGGAHGAHVFWHNLVTALHNNPARTERYAIPSNLPIYDDQIGYMLFDREISSRREKRSTYLVGDADWIYRTSSPDLDFRWGRYDKIMREIFLRTVADAPTYALNSLFVQQPVSALRIVLGGNFLTSRKVFLSPIPIILLALGALSIMEDIWLARRQYAIVLGTASVCVWLPVLVAAVVELRVIELFYILLVDAIVAGTCAIAICKERMFGAGHTA
jgi:hypothetical protein